MHEATAPPAAVWKSSGHLADGREIIYFDEAPGSGRALIPDLRDLGDERAPGAGPEPGLRWDPLVGEWVVVAAQRQGRTFLPPLEQCPLCPSRPGRPTEIPAADYDVVVFENRFPSLSGARSPQAGTGDGRRSMVPGRMPGMLPGMVPGRLPGPPPAMVPGRMPGPPPGMVPGRMPGMVPGRRPGPGTARRASRPPATCWPGGRRPAAARWSASPPITTRPSPT